MILNATRNTEMYSCISFESRQVFKRIFYLQQKMSLWGPPWSGGPGEIAPAAPPPLIRP